MLLAAGKLTTPLLSPSPLGLVGGGTLVTADRDGLGMEDSERAVLGAHEAQRKYYSIRNMCPAVKAFGELLFLHLNKLGKGGLFSCPTVKSFLAG